MVTVQDEYSDNRKESISMKPWKECPEEISYNTTYYCRVLQAERQGQEEEICGICKRFLKACHSNAKLQEAFIFAMEAHRGQVRKGTSIPYPIHLIRTWGYVQLMSDDLCEQEAAILHDILEDTEMTERRLCERFGERILELVVGESECKREERPAGETWQIRKSETIERLHGRVGKEEERPAMHIAFGDKLANLYSMWYEYRLVGDRLFAKFNQKEKQMHAWYYGEMGKIFNEFFYQNNIERKLVEDYRKYYREVFHCEI